MLNDFTVLQISRPKKLVSQTQSHRKADKVVQCVCAMFVANLVHVCPMLHQLNGRVFPPIP